MTISESELKNNLAKYMLLSATEEIFITRNGNVTAVLTNPYPDRKAIAESLFGILSDDLTLDQAKEDHLIKI